MQKKKIKVLLEDERRVEARQEQNFRSVLICIPALRTSEAQAGSLIVAKCQHRWGVRTSQMRSADSQDCESSEDRVNVWIGAVS